MYVKYLHNKIVNTDIHFLLYEIYKHIYKYKIFLPSISYYLNIFPSHSAH